MGLHPMLFGGTQLLREPPGGPHLCNLMPSVCGLGLGTRLPRIDVGKSDGMSFPG